MSNPDWASAGRHIRDRRLQLGWTHERAAIESSVSVPTWDVLENARRDKYRPRTITLVENALGWSPGSIERVLAGGEPVVTSYASRGQVESELAELRERVTRLEVTLVEQLQAMADLPDEVLLRKLDSEVRDDQGSHDDREARANGGGQSA